MSPPLSSIDMKILVADEDAHLLDLVAYALGQGGYLVVKATDGRRALETFDAEGPDLVILELDMSGRSGFDLCADIRERSTVPVMMLTARSDEQDLVRALELGADDYLTKPFSPRTLLARMQALLRRARREPGTASLTAGHRRPPAAQAAGAPPAREDRPAACRPAVAADGGRIGLPACRRLVSPPQDACGNAPACDPRPASRPPRCSAAWNCCGSHAACLHRRRPRASPCSPSAQSRMPAIAH